MMKSFRYRGLQFDRKIDDIKRIYLMYCKLAIVLRWVLIKMNPWIRFYQCGDPQDKYWFSKLIVREYMGCI